MTRDDGVREEPGVPLRVLIVDDEPLARRALRQLLEKEADVDVVAECGDAVEAASALREGGVDAVLLDIRMPEISGLALARELSNGPLVVFVTAHEDYGLPAFDTGAADYLVKPVTRERLGVALDRVRARVAAARDAARYRELAQGAEDMPERDRPTYVDRLVARVGDRDVIIPTADVDLIVADDVYASVHVGGRKYLLRAPLDRLARALDPAHFARVHRSYIVPLRRVVAVHRTGGVPVLELRNGATVPVSRRRRKELARLESAAARG
jgi:two-component system LytT family response regulator